MNRQLKFDAQHDKGNPMVLHKLVIAFTTLAAFETQACSSSFDPQNWEEPLVGRWLMFQQKGLSDNTGAFLYLYPRLSRAIGVRRVSSSEVKNPWYQVGDARELSERLKRLNLGRASFWTDKNGGIVSDEAFFFRLDDRGRISFPYSEDYLGHDFDGHFLSALQPSRYARAVLEKRSFLFAARLSPAIRRSNVLFKMIDRLAFNENQELSLESGVDLIGGAFTLRLLFRSNQPEYAHLSAEEMLRVNLEVLFGSGAMAEFNAFMAKSNEELARELAEFTGRADSKAALLRIARANPGGDYAYKSTDADEVIGWLTSQGDQIRLLDYPGGGS